MTIDMTLGLVSGTVALYSDHDDWAKAFDREKARIVAAIGPHLLSIEHVGSTAIPGVPAKPILDLLVGVANYEEAMVCIAPLEGLGYHYRGEAGIPRRHYFVKGEPRTHHLHMVETNGPDWRLTRIFRDALRSRPGLAREYAEAKLALAGEHPDDRDAYQRAKDRVVAAILKRIGSDKP